MSEYDNELRSIYGDAEPGRQSASPDTSGDDNLSDLEERGLRGDISDVEREQLNRDHGLSQSRPQPQENDRHNAEVRASLERKLAEYYGANQRLADTNARLTERQNMLTEAMSPEEPQQHAWAREPERPDPNEDIFANSAWNEGRIDRIEQMITDASRRRQHQEREQAEQEHVRQSLARHAAQDPEFSRGLQDMMYHRSVELAMRHHYPQATPDQIHQAAQRGQLPPHVVHDINRRLEAEIAAECKKALADRRDVAQHFQSLMVGRMGYQTAQHRAAIAQEQRRQEAARAAEARKVEDSENRWFERMAARVRAEGGSYEDALRSVLSNRADRMRYREIKARRQERSWPGSGSAMARGAW
jgi:hypothetical protein